MLDGARVDAVANVAAAAVGDVDVGGGVVAAFAGAGAAAVVVVVVGLVVGVVVAAAAAVVDVGVVVVVVVVAFALAPGSVLSDAAATDDVDVGGACAGAVLCVTSGCGFRPRFPSGGGVADCDMTSATAVAVWRWAAPALALSLLRSDDSGGDMVEVDADEDAGCCNCG